MDPLTVALFLHALSNLLGFPTDLEQQLESWPAWYRPHAKA